MNNKTNIKFVGVDLPDTMARIDYEQHVSRISTASLAMSGVIRPLQRPLTPN